MKVSIINKCPELAEEWSERNLPVTPDIVSYGSNKLYWWRGKCGHEWQASPHRRTGKRTVGCPYCSGNKVLPGFNDLASNHPEIAVEWSERNIPLTPDMVTPYSNQKVWWKGKCGHEWFALISSRTDGHGCPYCNNHKLLVGFNDLQTLYPTLASEWSIRNLPLLPNMITSTKSGSFWWKCSDCGEEYEAWVQSRVDGCKCPYCSGRIIKPGLNDLATTDPQIAAEWCYEANKGIAPADIHRNSKKIYWWKCPHGHRWQAPVSARTLDNLSCTKCEEEFLQFFPKLLFMYYLHPKGVRVGRNTDETWGLAVDILIPQLKLAIDGKGPRITNDQKVKQYMIQKAGFHYILLPRCRHVSEVVDVVRSILMKKQIHIKSKPEDDIRICREKYDIFLKQHEI